VVEYISVTAAVSLVALTIGSQLGGRIATLPTSTATALELVSQGARKENVSVPGARAAYRRAPYRKPALRYLYAAGWIGGTKHERSCLLTRFADDTATRHATSEIRKNAKLTRQLRKRGISPATAARTLVNGVVSACS
jgi:hypothetical protein